MESGIYFSIAKRKVLTPNDSCDLEEVASRLLAVAFQRRYERTAEPFEWKFTPARADPARFLKRLGSADQQRAA